MLSDLDFCSLYFASICFCELWNTYYMCCVFWVYITYC